MKKLLCIVLFLLLLTANVGQAQFNDTEPMFGQMLNLGHWATDGLVFYWRGIEAGEAVDESFLGNDGTITSTSWVGNGLDFDGANSLVNCGAGASLANLWVSGGTLSVRLFAESYGEGDNGRILAKSTLSNARNGWALQSRATNSGIAFLIAREADAGISERWLASMSLNAWHTIIVTYRIADNVAHIYIDGVEVAENHDTDTAIATDDDAALPFCIGNLPNQERTFDGIIADVKLYNRILSASEVLDLYINPDLPMQNQPIWLMFSPPAVGDFIRNIGIGGATGFGIGQGIGR